ncbi:hypothetical protein BJX66DRAFT_119261 [Aspergillus keveii]|uniref:Uncharacterized protein n=1 Tax=Aspergillus keveii TaxID=714993 RepID=A0ABR4FK62_9EURO
MSSLPHMRCMMRGGYLGPFTPRTNYDALKRLMLKSDAGCTALVAGSARAELYPLFNLSKTTRLSDVQAPICMFHSYAHGMIIVTSTYQMHNYCRICNFDLFSLSAPQNTSHSANKLGKTWLTGRHQPTANSVQRRPNSPCSVSTLLKRRAVVLWPRVLACQPTDTSQAGGCSLQQALSAVLHEVLLMFAHYLILICAGETMAPSFSPNLRTVHFSTLGMHAHRPPGVA